jgi:hypothetical protein
MWSKHEEVVYNKHKRSVQLVGGEICGSFNVTPMCFE